MRTRTEPSYLAEYRSAVLALAELRQQHGPQMWHDLFFGSVRTEAPTNRRGHLRRYVVEEFIKVWLTSGGFKAFGAASNGSFASKAGTQFKRPRAKTRRRQKRKLFGRRYRDVVVVNPVVARWDAIAGQASGGTRRPAAEE